MKIKPIIFGISGTTLTEKEQNFFKKNPVYGFILFRRNIESQDQLTTLVDELLEIYKEHSHKPTMFIDQEGGRVARLKPPIAAKEYPTTESFSKIYDEQGAEAACQAVEANYFGIMGELNKYKIDSPCAPVADLRYTYTDNVIGDRSFGSEVNKVVALCGAAIKGITTNNGIPIIKHIPGHGRATVDSHFDLPVVKTSLEELNKTDFEVFRQLAKNKYALCAMTAHIIFEALDPDLPVTISKKAITFIRDDIGFKGVLISDDIGMLALHGKLEKPEFIKSLANVALQSFTAGCDLVLHCSGNMDEMIEVAGVLPLFGEQTI